MRIGQLESLTNDELSLLLYVVNVLEPLSVPKIEIKPKELLWYKHDVLLWKLTQIQSKLTDEGKPIFESLMTKLNQTLQEQINAYERSSQLPLIQSEFQF